MNLLANTENISKIDKYSRLRLSPQQSKKDACLAFVSGRIIKLIANGLRPIFYWHYWLFPRKRFNATKANIHNYAKQDLQRISANQRLIPRYIWQTNYTESISLPVKTALLCNRINASGYEHCFHSDQDQIEFIEKYYPGKIFSLYKRLSIGAAKADLWRLLILYRHGGVYIDMDAHLVWPLDRIIESHTSEIFLRYKNYEVTNYFMAAKPKNEHIKRIIDEVLRRIEFSTSNNVYEITGPAVMEDVLAQHAHHWRLAQHTCLQGNFSNKFFQYLDKPNGCWTTEQQHRRVVSR